MKMFAHLRPVKAYPNTKSLSDNIDFMIVRENTEGLYIAGEESFTDEGAVARRIITREAEERIIDYVERCTKELARLGVTEGTMAVAGLNPHSGEHGLFGYEEVVLV